MCVYVCAMYENVQSKSEPHSPTFNHIRRRGNFFSFFKYRYNNGNETPLIHYYGWFGSVCMWCDFVVKVVVVHTHIHLMFMKMVQGNRLVLLVMAESEHENCSSGVCPDVGCKVRNWIRRSAGFYWLEFMT